MRVSQALLVFQICKFCRHRRVTLGQLLDRDILGLVIGQAQIAVGAEQGVFGLLQMIDRFVDLGDGGLEFA